MIARYIIFGFISLMGIACFISAAIYVVRGHATEWVTLLLAPISGICLAIVMNFSNIDLKVFHVRLIIEDGRLSFHIARV